MDGRLPHSALGFWLLLSLALHAFWLLPNADPDAPNSPVSPRGVPPVMRVRTVTIAPTPPVAPPRRRAPHAAPHAAPSATVALAPEPAQPLPNGQWRYRLRVNGEQGWADLDWQQDGAAYRLKLRRELAGRALPEWHSEGRLDAAGLQPLRFELRRQGRAREAVNFEPEAGLLRFSNRSGARALHAGAQDPLSWMWSLAARLSGRRAALRVGQGLSLVRVGWRGEQQHWVFRREEDDGSADLLHLVGRCEDPMLRIELWLDPRRQHLPLRLIQRYEEDARSEWTLESAADVASP